MWSISITGIITAQIVFGLLSVVDGELWPTQAVLQANATYDYIVVGGGSAGCVVARRLAEDKKDSVLVLEAGGNPPEDAMKAALFGSLSGSYVDYNYTSTRDEYAARGQNNFTMITTGKMLGGSDSLNHLLHLRGDPSDYDKWAELSDDNSWNYEEVLPYFKKSENVSDNEVISKFGEFHGIKGPMGLTKQLEDFDKLNELLISFAEVDNPTVLDLNADVYLGYAQPMFMIADQKRQTPAYSYIEPIKNYSNLYVSKNTTVTRIIFKDKVAIAVEAVYKGKTYILRANKEIIISAGVFNTPQLLMLSGIGPKEHLESLNITVVNNLPVGDNLVDQVSVTLVHKLKKSPLPIADNSTNSTDETKFPFPVIVGAVALNKSQTCPNYQTYCLHLAHDTTDLTDICSVVFGLREELCARFQEQVIGRDSLYTLLALLQPKSRGTVRLGSADPFADPLITTGYFTEDEDLENMVKYIKDFITVGNTEYFTQIGAELTGLDLPECADKEKGSDEFWKCYILNTGCSPYHFVGTCPMGIVVDSKLQVKGVQKLRVVDASVMPNIPRAAPNAAVIMLAEKASDMIKCANN